MSMAYTAPLDIRYDPVASAILGQDHWRVLTSFRYYIGDKYSGRWVFVPAGYLTDGASVPKIFHNVVGPWGAHGQAAVVHDILCEYLSITQDGLPVLITRKQANLIFLEAMEVLSVPAWRREVMYAAVEGYRIVGGGEQPSNTPVKRQLEAAWEERNNVALLAA